MPWRRSSLDHPSTRVLVVVVTHGIDHELSSVGLVIALGGMTSGLKVSIFLTSAGVDLVRCGASERRRWGCLCPPSAGWAR
jgi:predicted peroxiredoxin